METQGLSNRCTDIGWKIASIGMSGLTGGLTGLSFVLGGAFREYPDLPITPLQTLGVAATIGGIVGVTVQATPKLSAAFNGPVGTHRPTDVIFGTWAGFLVGQLGNIFANAVGHPNPFPVEASILTAAVGGWLGYRASSPKPA